MEKVYVKKFEFELKKQIFDFSQSKNCIRKKLVLFLSDNKIITYKL